MAIIGLVLLGVLALVGLGAAFVIGRGGLPVEFTESYEEAFELAGYAPLPLSILAVVVTLALVINVYAFVKLLAFGRGLRGTPAGLPDAEVGRAFDEFTRLMQALVVYQAASLALSIALVFLTLFAA